MKERLHDHRKSEEKFQKHSKEGIHIGNWILRWISQDKKELEILPF